MKNTKKILLVMFSVSLMAVFSGCLSTSSEHETQVGIVSADLPQFANASFLIAGPDGDTSISADDSGKFVAMLKPGRYQLLLQKTNGELILVRRELLVENNLTLVITDAEMIAIPKVISVSVPMIYSTSAIIEWETDIESDGHVEYGTSELYGMASYADTELKTRHRIQLYDLQPGVTYHFRIAASRYSLDSTTSLSRDYAFTTEP